MHSLASHSRKAFRACFVILWLALGTQANAHTAGKHIGDFYDGMLHPVLSLDHLLVLIVLGLLAGQHGGNHPRSLLIGMIAGAAVGGLLAIWTPLPPEHGLTLLLLAIMAMAGILVAGDWRLPRLAMPCLGASSAIVIALLTMTGRPEDSRPLIYCAGLLLTLILTVLLISGMATHLSRGASWKSIAVRVVGSWILAIALMMLAFTA